MPADDDRRWAAEQRAGLVAEARAEALEEARTRLREHYVRLLLDAAAERAPEPGPAPATGEAIWVYGVVDGAAADPPAVAGMDGRHRVELIRHGDLAALASRVPLPEFGAEALQTGLEDLERVQRLALAHEAVLEQALGGGPLVPFRLCTIYADAERVRAMLDEERAWLRDALERLRGCAEWGVKGYVRAPAEPVETGVGAPATGADYLARKREHRDAAEAARDAVGAVAEEVHARLSEEAAAAVVSRPHDRRLSGRDEEMVLNGAYLVPDDRTERFRALVSELGRRADGGIELELTGPWPAYHFVERAEGT